MAREPTVFVVEDDAAHRKSLAWLIGSVALPVETFDSGRAFLDALAPAWPGCVVADLRMPGLSGLDLQQELLARRSLLPIILVSGHAEIPAAVRAMRSGAIDFIEKPFSDQHLLDRIREALEHNAQARGEAARHRELTTRFGRLTQREREVMDAIVAGHANKVIAADLDISPKTVEAHRAHLMTKMRARSVADLVRASIQMEAGAPRPHARDPGHEGSP